MDEKSGICFDYYIARCVDICVTSNKIQRYVYTNLTWMCKGNTERSVNAWQNLSHISSSHQ